MKKGIVDKSKYGSFKGVLTEDDLLKLTEKLKRVNWESVVFPNVICCDKPVVQILLSYNGKFKTYKSMQPPDSVKDVISFLTALAENVQLPAFSGAIDFEEVSD